MWDVCWVRGADIRADPLQMGQAVFYFSGAVPLASIADYPVVPAAFAKSVADKLPGGLTSTADCTQLHTQVEALRLLNIKQIGTTRDHDPFGGAPDCSRAKCVMTDWTYTRDPNTATGPANAPLVANPCNSAIDHDLTKRPPGCAPTTLVRYVICYTNDTSPTDYISATFKVTAMDKPAWTNGFAQLLAQKYSYKDGGVACANVDETSAQTFSKNLVGVWRTRGKTVVETGWVFGSSPVVPVVIPAAAAPPAPAAAPAAATQPSTLYAVCWDRTGGIHTSAYFGVPFATTTRDIPVWTAAFKAFLNDQYGRASAGTVSCNVSPTLDAAQQHEQKWRDLSSRNGKTIETGWSYGSSPAASSASAAAAASTPAAPVVPSAQDQKYAVCWAEVPAHRTAYFSAPFPYAANFEEARTGYRKFVITKYGQVGQLNCRVLSSLAEAQQQTQTWMNAARAKDTIVETGWKYQ
jgi:hypothetical protein